MPRPKRILNSDLKIIILSAHPDDAEINMGGTIMLLNQMGAKVRVVNFTTSETTKKNIQQRQKAAKNSSTLLNYELKWIENGRYKQVEDIPEYKLVSIIDKEVLNYSPHAVFCHWKNDSHADHARLARATLASSRRWEANLYAFGPSETKTAQFKEFIPNIYVDITKVIDLKLKALSEFNYDGQSYKKIDLHLIKKMGGHYGFLSGYKFAEAFYMLRYKGLLT